MVDMIEKAARAIAADGWFDFTEQRPGDAELCNAEWMDMARRAIEAIRDLPDENIANAAAVNYLDKSTVKGVWFNCIDTILDTDPRG